ncbi:MAG: ATP-binding cassette domain-containing protein [Planctomycetaceae bacterium]|nr:ATP-binding cassette domain-containing protein [Planctomycetaceae bacterium]MBT6487427.1 ATP-binding cassette domain-containing protein [Planctomycetaceae bacterium]MBT6495598.1 ATP-binding cassette domain-containing protein [Planctomycetaceae bacterium]
MITVKDLCVRAGTFELKNVSFEIGGGEYGILMGRTGSGKTTILEAVCGLKRTFGGKILLAGRDVTGLKPAERGIGFVPQEGALFPTMKVRDQIGFALSIRRRPRAEIKQRVDELAELLGIVRLLDRFPQGLSGGERQRIALGRALAARPSVLCLDEPLSALDDASREEMYALLESIRKVTGVTALHITHSRSEARRLGSRAFFVHDGQVDPFDLQAPPVGDTADDLNGDGVIDSKSVEA